MKISIVGAAGTLGSCATFNIVTHNLADEIVMIGGKRQNILMSHWIDLCTAVSETDITLHMGSDENMVDSDIVINTAGVPSGQLASRNELLPGNLPLIKEVAGKINRFCPDAVVITATNPVDPLNYAMYLMSESRDRRKFIGYSLNDTLRFRSMSARALGVKTSRISGYVIGEHDTSQVALFSTLLLDGKPVIVDDNLRESIKEQSSETFRILESIEPKRTTGWTSARGLTSIIEGISGYFNKVLPCSAVLEGEYGCRNLSISVPVILGREGIRGIQELEITREETEKLKKSINTVIPHMRYVEEYVSTNTGG